MIPSLETCEFGRTSARVYERAGHWSCPILNTSRRRLYGGNAVRERSCHRTFRLETWCSWEPQRVGRETGLGESLTAQFQTKHHARDTVTNSERTMGYGCAPCKSASSTRRESDDAYFYVGVAFGRRERSRAKSRMQFTAI